jgi:hypothetical protein
MSKLRLLNYTLHYTATENIAKPLILFGEFQVVDTVNRRSLVRVQVGEPKFKSPRMKVCGLFHFSLHSIKH